MKELSNIYKVHKRRKYIVHANAVSLLITTLIFYIISVFPYYFDRVLKKKNSWTSLSEVYQGYVR